MAHHVDRVETRLDPLDLLAQEPPQHDDAGIGMGEVFQRVHRDRPLPFLCLEVIGLALALLVAARQRRAGTDVLDRIGACLPVAFRLAVFQGPGDNADAAHMLVVDRHSPGQFGAALLALRDAGVVLDEAILERVEASFAKVDS